MILHHYEASPFSEKIRLMFGYTEYAWQSCISPAMPPRPIVEPLVDAYRLIPIAQMGADIFCDTRVISSELANLTGKSELAAENCSSEVQKFVEYVDAKILSAGLKTASIPKFIFMMLKNYPLGMVYKFMKDRAGLMKTSTRSDMTKEDAKRILTEHNKNLEQKLSNSDYLFSDAPSIADFASYHLIWFKKNIGRASDFTEFPNINAWCKRMAKIGHGKRTEISATEVHKLAKSSQPREIPQTMKQDVLFGKDVQINPLNFKQMIVNGVLVGSDHSKWIIARETPDFGLLHLHFPKSGYQLVSSIEA